MCFERFRGPVIKKARTGRSHPADLPNPQLIYAGKEHPALAHEGGRIIYVTYIEFEEYYPHLLEITLA